MNIPSILISLPGMYITQSFFHSLTAMIVSDWALAVWKIKGPWVRQRFYLLAVLFPVLSFPLYRAFFPWRNSLYFRVGSILDSERWFSLVLFGRISLGCLFLSLLAATSLIFLFQELFPVLRHVLEARSRQETGGEKPAPDSAVGMAVAGLAAGSPDVIVVEDDPLLFSRTGSKPLIVLSTGLVEKLDSEQLQSAIAHEMAHVSRGKRPFLVIIFVLRLLMFFNPVALLAFRRAVQEEEKICDDMAVRMTKKPLVLAEALRIFLHDEKGEQEGQVRAGSADGFGKNPLIRSRIRRLEEGYTTDPGPGWFEFFATVLVISVLNYFII